jgi:DNA polymerase III subunit alpha, Gram-positive type
MSQFNALTDCSIDELDFTIFDFETTGLNPESGDRVLEIGAVKVRGGAIIDSYNTLVDPERPLSPAAFYINRISPQMIDGAPKFFEIAPQVLKFFDNSILAAYNSPFDMSFLESELRLSGYKTPTYTVIDVLKYARLLLPGIRSYKQANVAAALNIITGNLHRAYEDVIITSQIFSTITSILKAHGIIKLKDFTHPNLSSNLEAIRLNLVTDALTLEKNLWIKYFSPHKFEITERIITPHRVIKEGRDSFLLAYCHEQKNDRNFHLRRVLDIKII